MTPCPALLALTACLLLGPGPALCRGRWDHHPQGQRRGAPVTRTVTTPTTSAPPVTKAPRSGWDHRLGWSVPPERCQIPPESRTLGGPGGQTLNSYYIDHVSDLLVQDKTLVSPIVFEGAMVSRTNTYKNLYFVSFKVFRVLKGNIHQQLQGQLRLLFRTEPRPGARGQRSGGSRGGRGCQPVPFGVKSGRRYLVFARSLRAPGRYIAMARPEAVRRKSLREVKHILTCRHCVEKPQLKTARSKKVSEGGELKLKCKVTNRALPPPAIAWYRDGALLTPNIANIDTKKKRSILHVRHVSARDAGVYTCQAANILGTSSSTTKVSLRDSVPMTHYASQCPIHSYCLNGGICLYYQSIGELACRCSEGFTGQRCQFKKAMKFQSPVIKGCGAYGYDINQLCAAWTEAPEEMTREQYQEWKRIQEMEMSLKRNKTVSILNN